MISKRSAHKHLGSILLGFAILMVGMQMMSAAVSPLKESEVFTEAITLFSNPILGIVLGIGMTAILQSASASIGILQALSMTGALTFSAVFPIILGIGVGASCPVLFSAIGANKNGQRSAIVYLLINVIGAVLWGVGFYAANAAFSFHFMDLTMGPVLIALVNSVVRVVAGFLLFPFIRQIEKAVCVLIKDSAEDIEDQQDNADFDLLDERFLLSPALALGQCNRVILGMTTKVGKNVSRSLNLILEYVEKKYAKVQRKEDLIDKYESKLGAYLTVLSKKEMSSEQSRQTMYDLRAIGDLERIGDYASAIAHVTKEMHENNISFSAEARQEMNVMIEAERAIVKKALLSYRENNLEEAIQVKPFAAAISSLCEILSARHIYRLSMGECDLIQGKSFTELLNFFERIASHCVVICGIVRRAYQENPDYHVHSMKARELTEEEYNRYYEGFLAEYDISRNMDRQVSVEEETAGD